MGLQLALSTMRRGERALVYVTDPEYGYGPKVGTSSIDAVALQVALNLRALVLACVVPAGLNLLRVRAGSRDEDTAALLSGPL